MEKELRFLQLFCGFEKAFSTYTIKTTTKNQKVETSNKFFEETLTPAHISGHFKGIRGIGGIPLKNDNSVSFGCIDVDDYNVDVIALEQLIIANELPLLLCYSKSKGAHLFVFFKEAIRDANDVQALLKDFANKLKLSKFEIFPKQVYRKEDSVDIGSSINLPYFNCYNNDMSQCCICNGKEIGLEQFMKLAENISITQQYIDKRDNELEKNSAILGGDYEDAPPCIKQMLLNKIQGGERNNSLFNVGVFLKKKFSEDWDIRLQQVNLEFTQQPLAKNEIENCIVKVLNKKDYFYKCSELPCKLYCDKRKCRKCKYGLSTTNESSQLLSNLTQVSVKGNISGKDSVHWFLDYDNVHRIKLSTEELNNSNKLNLQIQEQLGLFVTVSKEGWRQRLSELFLDLQRIEIDEIYSEKEIFIGTFKEFLMRKTSRSADAINKGRIYEYEEKDEVYLGFTFEKLLEFYRERRRETLNSTVAYYVLKDLGAREVVRTEEIGSKNITLRFIGINKNFIMNDLIIRTGVIKMDSNDEKI